MLLLMPPKPEIEIEPQKLCYIDGCNNFAKFASYFCSDECQDIYWPKKKAGRLETMVQEIKQKQKLDSDILNSTLFDY